MSRLTRDGTAEPISRDQILRRERGQGKNIFLVQLTTSRIGSLIRLILSLAICDDHTYSPPGLHWPGHSLQLPTNVWGAQHHESLSTVDIRFTFGVDRAVWTLAKKMDDGAPWHKGVLQGAEKFMTSWHKEEEEASRRRATKQDFRDLEPPTHL